MNNPSVQVNYEHLPFYITAPGESDILFTAVTIALIAIVIGFGALYFTIQAIPDRLAQGTSKTQMQLVGLLGLISLFTLNNAYWIAAILLAAVRIPDLVTPLKEIARSMTGNAALVATDVPPQGDPTESSKEPTEGEIGHAAKKENEE